MSRLLRWFSLEKPPSLEQFGDFPASLVWWNRRVYPHQITISIPSAPWKITTDSYETSPWSPIKKSIWILTNQRHMSDGRIRWFQSYRYWYGGFQSHRDTPEFRIHCKPSMVGSPMTLWMVGASISHWGVELWTFAHLPPGGFHGDSRRWSRDGVRRSPSISQYSTMMSWFLGGF